VPFTQLTNLTGKPSMSVLLHWPPDGLPLGMQFMGPFGSKDSFLQLTQE
jgi:amidase